MLNGLESGLQRRFERHGPYEMFQELKLIFQANARIERYEVSNKFYNCKMEENSSVSEHILKMSGYNNHLIQLGVNLPDDSVIDRTILLHLAAIKLIGDFVSLNPGIFLKY